MMGMQPFPIFAPKHGYQTNTKPVFLPNDAWSTLENAYVYRERILKREGLKGMGRLERNLTNQSLGTTTAAQTNLTINNVFSTLSIPEAPPAGNAEFAPGSVVVTVGSPDTATFTDKGDGTFVVTGTGIAAGSYVNYYTGKLVLNFSSLTGGATITISFGYFASLPVMGIIARDQSGLNSQQTIWFDTSYAYVWNGSEFTEFIPGTTWSNPTTGPYNFFWGYNYRGAADNNRLLFVTNFLSNSNNPMRYTDGTTWTTFAPLVSATTTMFSARIIVAYYGRLLALNTWEGTTAGGAGSALNYFNRCRACAYSASPIATDVWRTDIFGQGIFLDAPTNEQIISATFIRNTLVVQFEQSTWQLRYVGEYGLPFIWERTSSDLGSTSQFSSVLFDNHMLSVGDKAITASTPNETTRIDLDIPDQVFDFENANNGQARIFGIRNYQKEVVYWNYVDDDTGNSVLFPNKVLLYNYRNSTWAIFRDNITAFGTFQISNNVTWDSLFVGWDSSTFGWDDFESQTSFPSITWGNQQGFVGLYQEDNGIGYVSPILEEPSLSITGVNLSVSPIQITVNNHNLLNNEVVYLANMEFLNPSTFLPITSDLNNSFFGVAVVDANTLALSQFNFTTNSYATNFPFTPSASSYLYVGGGFLTLVPRLNVQSKDINIYHQQSMQTKLSRLDFLMTPTSSGSQTINILPNATSVPGDVVPIWSNTMSTVLTPGLYPQQPSDYAWFRFYTTIAVQYFRINMTYSDALMNTLTTHQNAWTVYAINAFCRQGGKNVF